MTDANRIEKLLQRFRIEDAQLSDKEIRFFDTIASFQREVEAADRVVTTYGVDGPALHDKVFKLGHKLEVAEQEVERLKEDNRILEGTVRTYFREADKQGEELTEARAAVERLRDLIDNAEKVLEEHPWKDWSDHKVRSFITGLRESLTDTGDKP